MSKRATTGARYVRFSGDLFDEIQNKLDTRSPPSKMRISDLSLDENMKPASPGVIRHGFLHAEDMIDLYDLSCDRVAPSIVKKIEPENIFYDNNLLQLPEHILLKTFTYLSKRELAVSMRVCRRFHELAIDKTLWRKLIRVTSEEISVCQLLIILKRGITGASFTRVNFVRDCGLEHPPREITSFLHVSQIILDSCSLVNVTPALGSFLAHCPSLNTVAISSTSIDCNIINAVGELGMNLQNLSLDSCQGLTYSAIRNVILRCRRLSRLYLSWTGLSSDLLTKLLSLLPATITIINISGHRELREEGLSNLVGSCPNLTHVLLMDCSSLTSISHLMLLPKLQYLNISRCYYVHRSELSDLDELCSMETVDMFHYQKENLRMYLRSDIKINRYLITPQIMLWSTKTPGVA